MSIILNRIRELPIIGILRGIREEYLHDLADTVIDSGLKAIEITMNTPHAVNLISKLVSLSGDNLLVGAGTVMNRHELFDALEAGARYIVTPSITEEVIEYCYLNSIPVFPGALTPTEIHKAWQMGASMVKVFPASLFGPGYFKDIKGPFKNIELMAVGGVTCDNIAEYFNMGASAAAFGASIFKMEYLENSRYGFIEKGIKRIIAAYNNRQNKINIHHKPLKT
ncbi:MAG: bifunctional 4-hydroxy-2-oxoglutarate aldolase/2-dehydro-3-deoxy-phosphogluconate aldolase [Bacteroidales bacterium]|nr:bifunctional 4-hydroxy-2-oxoglutarate aldolase/2-dehydro-3-deoxy-phosphogluconate aldolase [Bacteroidales bacterium]